MSTTTTSHFDVADNDSPMQLTVKPGGMSVLLILTRIKSGLSDGARITPKQARRIADALRTAAREAEANSRPYKSAEAEETTP